MMRGGEIEEMRVRKFDLKFDEDQIEEFKAVCEDILTAPRPISNGRYVKEFEEAFIKITGSKYGTAVMNGTGALEVALRALELEGESIIIPTNTFISTALSVENMGAIIHPVDIENETFSLDPRKLEEALDQLDVGAVILVHIGGQISRHVDEIIRICNEYEVPLIEDASQAHCAEYKFKAGSFGEVGTFSFMSTKVMTTAEGGMIVTDNEKLDNRMKQIRSYGAPPEDSQIHTIIGGNYKMTEFQAGLGLIEMKRVKRRIEQRKKLSEEYIKRLKGNPAYNPAGHYGQTSYYKQIIQFTGDVIELKRYCKQQGIDMTGEVYYNPIHSQPIYRGRFTGLDFPVADYYCKHHICPPNYPELSLEQVRYVCDVLDEFMGGT